MRQGMMALKSPRLGANGIQMQTAQGGVGERPFVGRTTVGVLAEYGWAHQVTPIFGFVLLFCITTTDLELGSPGCPLLVISGKDHNAAVPDLQPEGAKREPAPGRHLEQLRLLRPGPPVEGWPHPQRSEWVLPSLFGCRGAQDEDLWCSLQRHREEFVPRLAADLLGICTQQHLRVFKLIHDSL